MTAKDKHGKGRGRKSIEQRNPRLLEEFCRCMVDGLTVDEAMAVCGIDRHSYRDWLKRDPEADRRIKMARSKRKSEYIAELRRLGFNLPKEGEKGDAGASATEQINALKWLAEKEFPLELGSRATLTVKGAPPNAMTTAALRAELQELLDSTAEGENDDDDAED